MSSRKSTRFAASVPRPVKRRSGRTPVYATPIAVRATGVALTDETREHASAKMSRQLAKFAERIERVSVRLKDVNGPRGGVDMLCRVKVVLSGLESVVYDVTAHDARDAIDRASHGIARAVRKAIAIAGGRAGGRTVGRPPQASKAAQGRATPPRADDEHSTGGGLIGRREGHAPSNLEAALDRPEKRRRDAVVDTSRPGVSASDRRAGGGSTARRNTKRNTRKATAMLEDSARARPSRKSTRRSVNRSKRDSNLRRRQTRATTAPRARAGRAQAAER